MSRFDLAATLQELVTRNPGRSEADIQARVREILVYGGFELGEETVLLESPAEDRCRLDISIGAVIIECKRDLRGQAQLAQSEAQLGGYLAGKALAGGRYIGLLTDGAIWRLYRHGSSGPVLVDELRVVPGRIDERAFRWWLGGVLATEHRLSPSVRAIEERLGADAPTFRLARATLLESWREGKHVPTVALKRELWAKLLRSALGSQFDDTDELFAEHTYLVLLATLIGHAVVGFDLNADRNEPGVLLSGQLFEQAGLLGVGQAGFFDWVLDTTAGAELVADMARRVATFQWEDVDHDVLKALYQSVIAPDVRKRLGEYYTPDWLAYRMVTEVITEPLQQRVLDPACGSGTFLFHAVRHYLDAAAGAGLETSTALENVTSMVFGVDLHPVAAVLAQTTYLLAIGRDRLAQRPAHLTVPVYLGDSMRWDSADESIFTAAGDVVVYTSDGAELFASELRFPASVVADVGRFDHLVNELATRASTRQPGGRRPAIGGLLQNFSVPDSDQSTIDMTFGILCDLYDQGRDHIWGFYVRNQSRPTWLSRPENRVDVLIGNPPWLAYRFMSPTMQKIFERRTRERHLWMGGARGRTTQQDLSAYFVARTIELYLRPGGRFGFVMPRAVLSRQTYGAFRAGDYSSASETCSVAFTQPWDLKNVRPDPFPVPSAVVFGTRSGGAKGLPGTAMSISGQAPTHGVSGGTLAGVELTVSPVTGDEDASPYKSRFRQGAILVPRMLIMVNNVATSPLGVPQGKNALKSRKTSLEKPPWKDLPPHEGVLESIFVRPAYLGESVAPFRVLGALDSVIPYDGTQLMDGASERIERYPGLATWWRGAEEIWMSNRSSEKRSLLEQLDYMRQLSAQFPIAPWRVVYTKAGNTMAAAALQDRAGIIDHKLYWAPVSTREEALYLTAVLNAPALTALVRPYQSIGAFGPRDFDKYVWRLPIPIYDETSSVHTGLVELAVRSEAAALTVDVSDLSFQTARRAIRNELTRSGLASELDVAVLRLIGEPDPTAGAT